VVGDAIMGTGMTKPTIAVALAQFLDEQERRLSPKTAAQYRDVVELLQHQLNGYAYLSLDERDAKRFERLQRATGDVQREFCQVFGPEHILPNVGEFLGYFMVRKVIASRALLRAAGTVTKRLVQVGGNACMVSQRGPWPDRST
jgi:glutamine synthetase adenylyltransferase